MILLAGGVAVLDEHTRRARLETNASIISALCTAVESHINTKMMIVHVGSSAPFGGLLAIPPNLAVLLYRYRICILDGYTLTCLVSLAQRSVPSMGGRLLHRSCWYGVGVPQS
jgi:hypothetical protein